jgi:F-type H+-transporting ATPase subunit epsilon
MRVASVHVELVSVERLLWSGEARMVIARTTEGELGVLPGHAPLLGELAPGGVVRIQEEGGGEELVFAVHGGFLSVTEDGVSILAELAERADEIDVGRAQQALERARSADEGDSEAGAAASRALSRLRASGQPV